MCCRGYVTERCCIFYRESEDYLDLRYGSSFSNCTSSLIGMWRGSPFLIMARHCFLGRTGRRWDRWPGWGGGKPFFFEYHKTSMRLIYIFFNGNFVFHVFFQGSYGFPGKKGERGDPGSQVTLFNLSEQENLVTETVLIAACQRLLGIKSTADLTTE